MLAMQPMVDSLQQRMLSQQPQKVPAMDNEYGKYTPIETILSRFEGISTKSFKRMIEGSLSNDTQIFKMSVEE